MALRDDVTAADLKRLPRASRDADQARRLLALEVICDGGSRAEAAETGGVGRQIVRDWARRFNAEGPDGLFSRKPPGNASKRGGVVRWRPIDLAARVREDFAIPVSEATMSRAPR